MYFMQQKVESGKKDENLYLIDVNILGIAKIPVQMG
jgi:hypothetical protein